MILVYIACSTNFKEAILEGYKLMEKGFSIFFSYEQPSRLVILERCDCLLTLDESDTEIDIARDHNILIFKDIDNLISFFEKDADVNS